MTHRTKLGSMASQTDYLKPRNKEMRDLAWNLPYPLRITDAKGKILWQNRAAESSEESEWSTSPTSWQGKKAVLQVPAQVARSQVQGQVAELEEEIARLKKQQRQTARKKRQAEAAAQKREKKSDSNKKKEQKLQSKLDKAEKDKQSLRAELAELKKASKSKAKKSEPKSSTKQLDNLKEQVAQLERELIEKSEAHAAAINQANSFLEEREKEHEASLSALRAEIAEEAKEKAKADNSASDEELKKLRDDKAALETWVEELEEKHTELREKNRSLAKRLADVQTDFYEFQAKVEEEDAQRQLAQKVQEFEELERRLEEEQRAFDHQREQLQQKLASQEEEFKHLKAGVESKSGERPAVSSAELEELKEELADSKADLQLAERREKRLTDKIATLEELRAEHGNVLAMLKEDLSEARERERELKETVKLYSDLRKEKGNQKNEVKELKEKLEAISKSEQELREQLETTKQALKESKNGGSGAEEVSLSMKTQLDFLTKRLADTEKELDQVTAQLKEEKAQNQSSKESERLAFQDSLTGLPNQHMIGRYLKFANQQAQTSGRKIALFLIDIDGFRVLNETYGRDWGDSLLKAVGERLNGMRGKSHLVARHSQDRFILLAAELEASQAQSFVSQASKSLLEALVYPFEVEGEEVCLTATLGVSLGPVAGEALDSLYSQAEVALDSAKRKSAATCILFDEKLKLASEQEKTYIKQMAHAIEKDEFKSVFQPIFHLTKGGVFGLELLTRWQHRDQRTLLPSEFLEAAIKSGLLFKITEKLWPKALADFAKWQKMRPGLTLNINLCDKELLSPTLLKKVVAWTKEARVDPKFINFEVRDQSRLRLTSGWWKVLQDYNKAGFGLCLDDFATDASLFGTLAYGGFRQAKLMVDDKSPKLVTSPHAAKGVEYCAKGLQTKFDPKALTKAGFHLAQGFAVSRPLDNEDVDMVFL